MNGSDAKHPERTARWAALLSVAAATTAALGCQGMAPPGPVLPADSCFRPGALPAPFDIHELGCRSTRTRCAAGARPEFEYVPARFHPVPTRPVFAPAGYSPEAAGEIFPEDGTVAAPGGGPLQIEVRPPAPVPERVVEPAPALGPQDRLTEAPRRLPREGSASSWLFPATPRSAGGRLADRRPPGSPSSDWLQR